MIVAYYTRGTPYEAEADRLRRSLARLNLPHEITPADDLGSWRANTRQKPRFLRAALERHARPILYLDADAYVHRDPWPLLDTLGGSIAAHRWVRPDGAAEWLAGTIYLRPTPTAYRVLDRWCDLIDANPLQPDQHWFNRALQDFPGLGVIDGLPVEYAFICDLARDQYPDAEPVIEHLQASREYGPGESCHLPGRLARVAELGAA